MKISISSFSDFLDNFDKNIDSYLKGEKEVWEYDEVYKILKFIVRVMTLLMPLFFYLMAGAIFYLGFKGVELKGLGVLVAAIIAGSFAMLSSIVNTEANIRSLRSAWIEESRKDLAKYITNSRRYLIAAEQCRRAKLQKERISVGVSPVESDVSLAGLGDIERKIYLREDEAIEANMKFFESYAAINVKYRGMNKGTEVYVYEDLKDHYKKYRKVCSMLRSENIHRKVDKTECYNLDAKLGDRFRGYFIEEWRRAKKGDKDLTTKKNIIISILVFFVLAYSHNVMINSFSFDNESHSQEEKVSTET